MTQGKELGLPLEDRLSVFVSDGGNLSDLLGLKLGSEQVEEPVDPLEALWRSRVLSNPEVGSLEACVARGRAGEEALIDAIDLDFIHGSSGVGGPESTYKFAQRTRFAIAKLGGLQEELKVAQRMLVERERTYVGRTMMDFDPVLEEIPGAPKDLAGAVAELRLINDKIAVNDEQYERAGSSRRGRGVRLGLDRKRSELLRNRDELEIQAFDLIEKYGLSEGLDRKRYGLRTSELTAAEMFEDLRLQVDGAEESVLSKLNRVKAVLIDRRSGEIDIQTWIVDTERLIAEVDGEGGNTLGRVRAVQNIGRLVERVREGAERVEWLDEWAQSREYLEKLNWVLGFCGAVVRMEATDDMVVNTSKILWERFGGVGNDPGLFVRQAARLAEMVREREGDLVCEKDWTGAMKFFGQRVVRFFEVIDQGFDGGVEAWWWRVTARSRLIDREVLWRQLPYGDYEQMAPSEIYELLGKMRGMIE